MRIALSTLCIGIGFSLNAQIAFKEVSETKGLNYIYPGNDFQMAGGGVMVIDVNNDGWEDLFQAGGVFPSKLWMNNKGVFSDRTAELKIDTLDSYFIQGAVAADYNKDGFTDFIIANYGIGMSRGDKKVPVLMKNVKGKYFVPVSLEGVLPKGNYASACWGDVNNDGWIDVYFCNYVKTMGGIQDEFGREIGYDPTCYENKLLINHGGNNFTEESISYGVSNPGCSLASRFHDVDNDGDQDLMLLNDFGEWTNEGNRYYANNFPKIGFTDMSIAVNFDTKMYGMGIGIGDYKNDGNPGYYITNIGENELLHFSNGAFVNVAKILKVDLTYVRDTLRGTSWTPLFFDADMDGDLDLYVSKGNVATLVPKTVIKDPNMFFENVDGVFVEKGLSAGLNDPISHRGSVIIDFDHDGDLDIISSVVKLPWAAFQQMEQKMKLFENVSQQGNWVAIQLVPKNYSNADAFGAVITFKHKGKIQKHVLDAGSGQASQSTRTTYFGLSEDTVLEEVEIQWCNGTKSVFKNLSAQQIHELKE